VAKPDKNKLRRQTESFLVRLTPEEKARLDESVPHGQLGPLVRRLLAEHLASGTDRQLSLPVAKGRGAMPAA
jgi:hypothetical protein